MSKSKILDQFYTKPKIAKECLSALAELIDLNSFNHLLEPSAGSGAFYAQLDPNRRIGIDLDPQCEGVERLDFFKYVPPQGKIATIGNPPFGKRSRLAIDFFLNASKFSEVIAFVVPLQWQKWSVQSKIPKNWKLILDKTLTPKAFTHNGKDYTVRCCFQIWVRSDLYPDLIDLRMSQKLATDHPDFEMYLYNNTPQALKFFDYDWDFAVPRQGYADYSRRETNKDNCERTTQWIFFKAKNAKVLKRLKSIDFDLLSKKNTSTPGWGKADLVAYYKSIYG